MDGSPKLTRQALADEMVDLYALSPGRALKMVNLVVDGIARALADARVVELRGIGTFRWYMRRPTRRRHPGSGEMVEVPARPFLRFVAAKALRKGGSGAGSGRGRKDSK